MSAEHGQNGSAKTTRDQQIVAARIEGKTLQQIADAANLSREGVRSILRREAGRLGYKSINKAFPKPRIEKPKPAKLILPGKTIQQAAKLLKMSAQCLKQLCIYGRVPFIVKYNAQWFLPPKAILFVRRHPQAPGPLGQRLADKMRTDAARLDPACKPRQEAHARRELERLARLAKINRDMLRS